MKDNKVYKVHTGIVEKNYDNQLEDMPNFSAYTIVANDAEEAIKKVKKNHNLMKNEYIESVEKVTTLNE